MILRYHIISENINEMFFGRKQGYLCQKLTEILNCDYSPTSIMYISFLRVMGYRHPDPNENERNKGVALRTYNTQILRTSMYSLQEAHLVLGKVLYEHSYSKDQKFLLLTSMMMQLIDFVKVSMGMCCFNNVIFEISQVSKMHSKCQREFWTYWCIDQQCSKR